MAYDLIALGNSMVDYVVEVDKEFLCGLGYKEGSCEPISNEERSRLEAKVQGMFKRYSGGSAANTAAAFANLGGKATYLGAVGNDDNGKFFKKDMGRHGIKGLRSIKTSKEGYTGVVMNFVADGERTMRFDLSGSPTLAEGQLPCRDGIFAKGLSSRVFKKARIFHTTGYVVDSMPETLERALSLASWYGTDVSLDLGSGFIVEKYGDELWHMIQDHVSVIFANEEEAKAITGKPPETALSHLADFANITVVKLGKDGSLIKGHGQEIHVHSKKTEVINTTGAGDSYAGAFLFGLNKGWDLDYCGRVASAYASHVVNNELTRLNYKPRFARKWST